MGYIEMCRCEEYGFQAVYSRIGVYKSEHLGLEQGIIFQETDQLVEDFIQTRETATIGQGGFGEFTHPEIPEVPPPTGVGVVDRNIGQM